MSDTYPDLTLTAFPESVDEIDYVNDISVDTYDLMIEYNTLLENKNFNSADNLLAANPNLKKCIIDAGKINKMQEQITSMQRYEKSGTKFIQTVKELKDSIRFIYLCTGTDDNLKIQNIISDFITGTGDWQGTTETSLKLIITGIMGLQELPEDGIYFNFSNFDLTNPNPRNATVYLDFQDCTIPEITLSGGIFFQFGNSGTFPFNLCIDGLKVISASTNIFQNSGLANIQYLNCEFTSENGNIRLQSGMYTFTDCTFTNTAGDVVIRIDGNCTSIFNHCIINGNNDHAITNYSSESVTFNNCSISSIDSAIYQRSSAGVLNIDNCNLTSTSYNTLTIVNTTSKALVNIINSSFNSYSYNYSVLIDSYGSCDFIDCKMYGGNGVYASSDYSGYVDSPIFNFTNCMIYAASRNEINYTVANCIDIDNYANVNLTNCKLISYGHYPICIGSSFARDLNMTDCFIHNSGRPCLCVLTANTSAYINLIGNKFIEDTGTYPAIFQETATLTVKWHLIGNKFSGSTISINGSYYSYNSGSSTAYNYMPAYSNKFNVIMS